MRRRSTFLKFGTRRCLRVHAKPNVSHRVYQLSCCFYFFRQDVALSDVTDTLSTHGFHLQVARATARVALPAAGLIALGSSSSPALTSGDTLQVRIVKETLFFP